MDDCVESDIVFKWTFSCRLCLKENAEIDIFDSSDEVFANLLNMFNEHFNFLMYRGDPMPRKLCKTCNDHLESWHQFKAKCIETDINLKNRLRPFRSLGFVGTYLEKLSFAPPKGNDIARSSPASNQDPTSFVTVFKKEPWDGASTKDSSTTSEKAAEPSISGQKETENSRGWSENDNSADTIYDDCGGENEGKSSGLNILRQMADQVNTVNDAAAEEESTVVPTDIDISCPPNTIESEMDVSPVEESAVSTNSQVVESQNNVSDQNEETSAISSTSSMIGTLKVKTNLGNQFNSIETSSPVPLGVLAEPSAQKPLAQEPSSVETQEEKSTDDVAMDIKQEPGSPMLSVTINVDPKLYNLRPRDSAGVYGEAEDWPDETSTPPPRPARQKVTPWKCEVCSLYFTSIRNLTVHQSSQDCVGAQMDSYSCLICAKKFFSENNLAEHNLRHLRIAFNLNVDELRHCRKCDLAFADPWRLKEHGFCHIQKGIPKEATQYPCDQCGLVFIKKTLFDLHMQRHQDAINNPQLSYLDLLPQGSEQAPSTVERENSPQPEKEISCSLCIARFKGEDLLYDHRFAVHGIPDERIPCNLCSRKFRDKNGLSGHMNVHRSVARKTTNPYFKISNFRTLGKESGSLASGSVRCRRCGMVFYSREELSRHEAEKHKNAMPFMCRKCSRRFPTRSLLLLHHREHVGTISLAPPRFSSTAMNPEPQSSKQPYITGNTCRNCLLEFKCDADLQEHVTSHLKFGNPSARFRHIERLVLRFQCSGCPQMFSSVESKMKHSFSKHSGEPIDFIPLQIPISRSAHLKPQQEALQLISCSVCGLNLKSQASLNFHIKIKHSHIEKEAGIVENEISPVDDSLPAPSSQKCPFCINIVSFSDIAQHMREDHPNKAVRTCRFCPRICNSVYNLGKHELSHQKDSTNFHCRYCNKPFLRRFKQNCKRHEAKCKNMLKKNPVTPPTPPQSAPPMEAAAAAAGVSSPSHRCGICANTYETQSLLELHSMTAHGMVPLKAPLSRELWQEEMNKIMRVVGGVQRCTLCQMHFESPEAAAWHRSQHPRGNLYVLQIDDSLFQCTVCDQLFNNRRSALHHAAEHAEADVKPMLVDSDEPNFSCPFCNSTFASEQSIRSHIYYVHPGGPVNTV